MQPLKINEIYCANTVSDRIDLKSPDEYIVTPLLSLLPRRGYVKSQKMRFVLAGLTRNLLIISIAFSWDSASSAE